MSQLVTGIYSDPSVAQAVIASLDRAGYAADSVLHLKPAEDQTPALRDAGMSAADAAAVAAQAGSTGTVVGVRPPFGHAAKIMALLQSYQAGHLSIWRTADSPTHDWNNAAPLSSRFGWPVLTDNAFPFSRLLNWSLLANGFFLSARLGWGMLFDDPAPLSRTLNAPVLSSEAAPFSRLLGLPTLSNNPAPLSSLLGLKLLS